MAKLIATAEMHESTEFSDVILRISTVRGSNPIAIQLDGIPKSAQEIGEQILEVFNYLVESEVLNG